jgi:hypothetical protein
MGRMVSFAGADSINIILRPQNHPVGASQVRVLHIGNCHHLLYVHRASCFVLPKQLSAFWDGVAVQQPDSVCLVRYYGQVACKREMGVNELIGLLDPKSIGTSTAALLVVVIIVMQIRKMNRVDAGDQFVNNQYQGVINLIKAQYENCVDQHRECETKVSSLESRVMQLEMIAANNKKV